MHQSHDIRTQGGKTRRTHLIKALGPFDPMNQAAQDLQALAKRTLTYKQLTLNVCCLHLRTLGHPGSGSGGTRKDYCCASRAVNILLEEALLHYEAKVPCCNVVMVMMIVMSVMVVIVLMMLAVLVVM